MDTTTDLTNRLGNFAKACTLKAENLRKEAAEVKARPTVDDWPEVNRVRDREAAQLTAQAQAWQDRATNAEQGYLLMDMNDVTFQMAEQELVSTAQSCGRVKYIEPMASPVPLR